MQVAQTARSLLRRPLLAAALVLLAVPAVGQTPSPSGSLVERQEAVRERLARLENRMLELAALLDRSEPDKADRLRDTLDLAGRRQVRGKLETLLEQLRREELSQADATQGEVLGDLAAMLELLTSSLSELDRLREERERLQELQEQVEELLDQQRRLLYQTRRASNEQRRATERGEPGEPTQRAGENGADADPSGDDAEAAEQEERARTIRRLEELQRDLQQRTAAAGDAFPEQDGESERFPGEQSLEQAGQRMQNAGDRLGEQQPGDAEEEQTRALEEMQRAVDELEESLRQLRQQEREETLTALESRLNAILSRERRVHEAAGDLAKRPAAEWARLEELQLTEARTLHDEALEETAAAVRILIEEGTAIVVPDLLAEIEQDMRQVAEQLARSDVGAATHARLGNIVAALEELLAAVEQQQDSDAQPQGDQQPQQQAQSGPKPLFNRSAELRLLRAAQVRINGLSRDPVGPPAAELSQRQERLADQARRLREAE